MIDTETIAKINGQEFALPANCIIPVSQLIKILRLTPMSPSEVEQKAITLTKKHSNIGGGIYPGLSLTDGTESFSNCIATGGPDECMYCISQKDCPLLDIPRNDEELPRLIKQHVGTTIKQAVSLNGLRLSIAQFPIHCNLNPLEINANGMVESEIGPYSNLVLMPDTLTEDELVSETALALMDATFGFGKTPQQCKTCRIDCPIFPEEI